MHLTLILPAGVGRFSSVVTELQLSEQSVSLVFAAVIWSLVGIVARRDRHHCRDRVSQPARRSGLSQRTRLRRGRSDASRPPKPGEYSATSAGTTSYYWNYLFPSDALCICRPTRFLLTFCWPRRSSPAPSRWVMNQIIRAFGQVKSSFQHLVTSGHDRLAVDLQRLRFEVTSTRATARDRGEAALTGERTTPPPCRHHPAERVPAARGPGGCRLQRRRSTRCGR